MGVVMNFTATGGSPSETPAPGTAPRLSAAAWIWERLRSAGKPVALGQLIHEAREAGILPTPAPDQPQPKLTPFYQAKTRCAENHPGWHVAQTEAPGFGGKGRKLWSIASGPDPDAIDYKTIRLTIKLRQFVENDLGQPLKGGRWPCPIHKGSGPNFAVDGERWKCWTCGESGDVIDYVARRENISRAAAARRLDPSTGTKPYRPSTRPATPPPAPIRASAWEDPAWQAAVDKVVCDAEAFLWSKPGRPALEWVRARGIDDATARRFRLGFNDRDFNTEPLDLLGPDKRNRPQGLWVRRGMVLPWVRPGSWYSVADDRFGDPGPRWVGFNVRRLPDGDVFGPIPKKEKKYQAAAGSERGHCYPWSEATAPGEPALVCEGEFDALVGWQEVGHVVNVVSIGGAGQKAQRDDARAFLAVCPDWLLLFDADDAGDGAARDMARRSSHRCKRLFLPAGTNDLNDLHRDGGSVLGWLRSEHQRFGWPWPLRS